MLHVSAGVSATTQHRMNGPWTTSTLGSSVPTCAVDTAGVTTAFAGTKHLQVQQAIGLQILRYSFFFMLFLTFQFKIF